MDSAYTDISLNDAYRMSLKHALVQIEVNGGKAGDDVVIKVQKSVADWKILVKPLFLFFGEVNQDFIPEYLIPGGVF